MAKGDHSRSQNRIDEQMKQSQGYLSGTQQNLANQWGNFNNLYWGGNPYGGGQTGGSFGYGSTVPNFSWTGSPYFSGNGTDTPANVGGGVFGGSSGSDPKTQIMSYLQSLGPANSQTLEKALPQLQQMFPGLRPDSSGGPLDELYVPGVGLVDFIQGAEGGSPNPNWTFNTGGGGGGFGGFGGFGSIPGMAMQDYGNIMNMYQNLFGDVKGKYGGFLGAAQNMAQTGGLSEGDKANLRSRAISPIRSVYANSLRNVNQQRALQGGYSPGYTTAMGRFNREMGQGVSDATTNAEAAIAELVQKGQLGGLGAWGSGLSGYASGLGGLLGGMTGLYGTQPGMAKLFGDQTLAAMDQQLRAAALQNQLSLGMINAQNESADIPGNFQSAMGNINSVLGTAGKIGGMVYPWMQGGPNMGMGAGVTPGTNIGYSGGIDPNTMFNPAAYGGATGAGVLPSVSSGVGGYGYAAGSPGYVDYASMFADSPMKQPMWSGGEFQFGGDNNSNYGQYFGTPTSYNYTPYSGGSSLAWANPQSHSPSNPQWSGAGNYPFGVGGSAAWASPTALPPYFYTRGIY